MRLRGAGPGSSSANWPLDSDNNNNNNNNNDVDNAKQLVRTTIGNSDASFVSQVVADLSKHGVRISQARWRDRSRNSTRVGDDDDDDHDHDDDDDEFVNDEGIVWIERELIGKGTYGEVFRAALDVRDRKREDMAVKILRSFSDLFAADEPAFLAALHEFQNEAKQLLSLHHPNVLPLRAVCTLPSGELGLVTPFCNGGSLRQCMKAHRRELQGGTAGTERQDFTLRVLLRISKQVARALVYLHDHDVLHRDLAARNVLCARDDPNESKSRLTVFLADLGLSRALSSTESLYVNDKQQRPVRWSAPEVLTAYAYSKDSDIFALAVLYWEIWSCCDDPFFPLADREVISRVVVKNERLGEPSGPIGFPACPPSLSELMRKCWDEIPAYRPKSSAVLQNIIDIRKQAVAQSFPGPSSPAPPLRFPSLRSSVSSDTSLDLLRSKPGIRMDSGPGTYEQASTSSSASAMSTSSDSLNVSPSVEEAEFVFQPCGHSFTKLLLQRTIFESLRGNSHSCQIIRSPKTGVVLPFLATCPGGAVCCVRSVLEDAEYTRLSDDIGEALQTWQSQFERYFASKKDGKSPPWAFRAGGTCFKVPNHDGVPLHTGEVCATYETEFIPPDAAEAQPVRVAAKIRHVCENDHAIFARNSEQREALRASIERELQTLMARELQHPNIVKFCAAGFGLFGGDIFPLWVLTEFVPGGNLESWIQSSLPNPPRDALRVVKWMFNLGSVLAVIHQRGFVHRNIQPSSILIDSTADTLKLASMRYVAVLSKSDVTGPWQPKVMNITNALSYRAPEVMVAQAAGSTTAEYSHAVDAYSFGAVMYEVVTFDKFAQTSSEQAKQIEQLQLRDEYFGEVIAGLCRMEPSQRFSCSEAVRKLRVLLKYFKRR